MNYFANREERKEHAVRHTEQMKTMFPKRIVSCITNSKIYGEKALTPKRSETKGTPDMIFVNEDTVSAILKYADDKTAVLNFASFKNPGGMFIEGSSAQEESLCHESYLYNVLKEIKGYYEWNNEHKNKALYVNRAIYTPNVVFARKDAKMVDVLTCAAPNYKAAARYQHVTKEENDRVLKDRIEFVRDICETENVEIFITGAFGCGVFGQNANTVAQLFYNAFKDSSVKKVIFAVPGNDKNAQAFRQMFKEGE